MRVSSFGSKCELTDAYMKKVANCGVIDQILSYATYKQSKELKKSDGSKRQRITGRVWEGVVWRGRVWC